MKKSIISAIAVFSVVSVLAWSSCPSNFDPASDAYNSEIDSLQHEYGARHEWLNKAIDDELHRGNDPTKKKELFKLRNENFAAWKTKEKEIKVRYGLDTNECIQCGD